MCHRFFLLSLVLCTPVFASDVPLFLIAKTPIRSLSTPATEDTPYEPFSYGKHGFINAGKSVYFGDGCWTYDLKEKSLKCNLPRSLNSVNIGDDGRWVFGCVDPIEGRGNSLWMDTVSSIEKKGKESCSSYFLNGNIDRSGRYIAAPTRPGGGSYYGAVDLYYLEINKSIEGKPFKGGREIFREFLGFSTDGKSLLFTTSGSLGIVDAKTLKLRSAVSPPFAYFIAGHSGNVVAGFAIIENSKTGELPDASDFNENSPTSVWDIKKRKYLWKEKNWGQALAFSPDDQYLLTNKHVVNLKTGEIVGSNYIGKEGKISPDNKTLLTKDDQYFYIYKIGKN